MLTKSILSSSLLLTSPDSFHHYHQETSCILSMSSSSSLSEEVGETVLQQVQSLASRVAAANERGRVGRDPSSVKGTGGRAFKKALRPLAPLANKYSSRREKQEQERHENNNRDEKQVWTALENLERDSEYIQDFLL